MYEFAKVYHRPGAERDYIVLSEAGRTSCPTATHEYVHLNGNHAGMKLPPWLNEGLADLYSTLKPEGQKILVGSLVPGRQQGADSHAGSQSGTWQRLCQIRPIDHVRVGYRKRDVEGLFPDHEKDG